MRVSIHAVGRMKSGPEKELADRYLERFRKSGGAVGLEGGGVAETVESRARSPEERKREEGRKLVEQAGAAPLILLDEGGRNLSSREFAQLLADLRDRGEKQLTLAIGGPDGHDPEMKARAERVISFGKATWPHQLVRVMLAEQLYRAVTILSGHPYHRD